MGDSIVQWVGSQLVEGGSDAAAAGNALVGKCVVVLYFTAGGFDAQQGDRPLAGLVIRRKPPSPPPPPPCRPALPLRSAPHAEPRHSCRWRR
jgi:hypothetical protein